jgi:hypothetical protein
MYRSAKLLSAAKDAPCMNCYQRNDTVVACHSNWQEHGKGTGLKAHDCFVAYLCRKCHDCVDGRWRVYNAEERKRVWHAAHDRTVLYWFEEGIVKA